MTSDTPSKAGRWRLLLGSDAVAALTLSAPQIHAAAILNAGILSLTHAVFNGDLHAARAGSDRLELRALRMNRFDPRFRAGGEGWWVSEGATEPTALLYLALAEMGAGESEAALRAPGLAPWIQ